MQIAEMKKASASTSKTDHELQNRLDRLEEELMDKDATIAELSKHLEENSTNRNLRTSRRQKTGEDESTAVALKKDLEDLRRQVSHREFIFLI